MKKIKKWLVNLSKKNQTFRTILRKCILIKNRIIYKFYCLTNKVEDIAVFESFMGRSYSCSPRAIYEEMLKRDEFKNFKFIWFLKNDKELSNMERTKIIKYGSKEYYKYYSKAKYFVSNSRIQEAITKRKGQVYIQCWHGTPLKKLGYDLTQEGGNALNSLKDMCYKYKVDAQRYTYLLSPSKFTSEKLTTCFNLKENNPNIEIIEEGYPRNDFLYNFTEEDVKRIKEELGIEKDNRKIILYAPTWRDNQHESGLGYTYKAEVDFDYLQENLSEEYIILFRAHYFVANSFDFEKYKGFVYDVSKTDDINDLYVIADVLITDYSSVFFDYANLKRPMIFYMYDLEEYRDEIRGFYLTLDELPGKITKEKQELVDEIKRVINENTYDERYKKFNEKFNYLDDGKAAKRVVDRIM